MKTRPQYNINIESEDYQIRFNLNNLEIVLASQMTTSDKEFRHKNFLNYPLEMEY